MSSLLTIAECRAFINTSKTDAHLQVVIDRAEAMITSKIGAAQDDGNTVTIVETVNGGGDHLFTRVAFSTVVSITEDGAAVEADEYLEHGTSGMVENLYGEWGDVCVITYKPADQQAERIQAAIDLVRLMLERTAMASENIAGEYSYNAPDWDKAIKRVLKNLCFTEV